MDVRENDAGTDQEVKKELVGSLTEKKGCIGRNGERDKRSGQKEENREDLEMLGLKGKIINNLMKLIEIIPEPKFVTGYRLHE
ncbi:hypothetical protein ANN_23220, partial [Periplaneta americana]